MCYRFAGLVSLQLDDSLSHAINQLDRQPGSGFAVRGAILANRRKPLSFSFAVELRDDG